MSGAGRNCYIPVSCLRTVALILTDPNFLHQGQPAYLRKGLFSRRLTEPAMQPVDLPALDAVVLSHRHGDHFDRIARRELSRDVPLLTTPQAARRLRRRLCTL